MNIKSFLGIKSVEDKTKEYVKIQKGIAEINNSVDELAKDYSLQKSLYDERNNMSEENKEDFLDKYNYFIKSQISKIDLLKNRKSDLVKKLEKLKKDTSMKEVIDDIDFEKSMINYFNKSIITKKFLFDSLGKRFGKVRFADVLVRHFSPEKGETVLLLSRVLPDMSDEGWGLPGGHVEIGEDFIDAAKRELMEETSLDLDKSKFVKVHEYSDDKVSIEYYSVMIDDREKDLSPVIVDSSEHSAFMWCPREDVSHYHWAYENSLKQVRSILNLPNEDGEITCKKADIIVKAYNDGLISSNMVIDALDRIDKSKTYFSEEERKRLTKEGEAMSDGSFPIRNEQDLKDAIKSVGLAKNEEKAKKWIIKRAKELDKEDLLPKDWTVEKDVNVEETSERHFDGQLGSSSTKVTNNYTMKSKETSILDLLYKALAEEFLAWYQYYIPAQFLVGRERPNVEKTFIEQGNDELNDHASKLIQRISELNGGIDKINDASKWRELTDAKFIAPTEPYDVRKLIEDNILAEEEAINRYNEIIEASKDSDQTTLLMAQQILTDEQEHLRALKDFIADMDKNKKDNKNE